MENQTEIWKEVAYETFDMGIAGGDYETCKFVIDDIFDKGFTKESLVLEQMLLSLPLSNFAIETPWK